MAKSSSVKKNSVRDAKLGVDQAGANKHLVFFVELIYFTLFVPLLFFPFLGWGALWALHRYRDKLAGEKLVNLPKKGAKK